MIENYIPLYLIITLLFSYLSAFYLRKRFPGADEIHKELDNQTIKQFKRTKLQKYLAKVSLYKNNRFSATFFIFLFNIAIPIVGYLFTIWIVWYLTQIKYEKKVTFTNILDLNEFKNSFMKIERVFGEGSMINLINNEYVPKSKKLRALATLATNPSPSSLTIIKQTLSSRDDEIRLYGYSILNNLEKKINSKINSSLQIIHENAEIMAEEKAEAAMSLAFAYWELVYMELSHESLKNNFLNSSMNYINLAKKFYLQKIDIQAEEIEKEKESLKYKLHKSKLHYYYEKASNLYTLAGRIHLFKEEYEDAQSEFTIAKELLPENSTAIIPYLAEVYYNIKKYNITKSVLNQYDSLRFNAKLYPLVVQWEKKSA
jgi:hypothetical protein